MSNGVSVEDLIGWIETINRQNQGSEILEKYKGNGIEIDSVGTPIFNTMEVSRDLFEYALTTIQIIIFIKDWFAFPRKSNQESRELFIKECRKGDGRHCFQLKYDEKRKGFEIAVQIKIKEDKDN